MDSLIFDNFVQVRFILDHDPKPGLSGNVRLAMAIIRVELPGAGAFRLTGYVNLKNDGRLWFGWPVRRLFKGVYAQLISVEAEADRIAFEDWVLGKWSSGSCVATPDLRTKRRNLIYLPFKEEVPLDECEEEAASVE